MSFTPWINSFYLKSLTPINNNIDITEVSNHIESAQVIYTRELLGKLLYDDIDTKFQTGTFSTREADLFDLCKSAIAYRASEIAIPFLGIKIRNKGVVRLNDEYAQPASVEEIKYLRAELKNRAEYMESQVQNYLYEYNNDFPLWTSSKNAAGDKQLIYPTPLTPYDSDIFYQDYDKLRRNRYYYGPNSNEPGNSY